MARGGATRWILALVAIVAIVAGNLTPVRTQEGGGLYIQNLIDGPIRVICTDTRGQEERDLGDNVLLFQQDWNIEVPPSSFQDVYGCQFFWYYPTGPGSTTLTQDINVWQQDALAVHQCIFCSWRIQENGLNWRDNSGNWNVAYFWVPQS
ncbi:unnamed protein product [Calypogeia fissa]